MRRPRAEPLSTSTASPSSSSTQHRERRSHRSRRSQDSRTSTTGPNSNARFLPTYHINNFESGGMPVSLWGMDRRDVWRTCFCFHVRTVTIFIGVWYLVSWFYNENVDAVAAQICKSYLKVNNKKTCFQMIYILELSFNAALLMYEPGQDSFGGMTVRPETMLPTPVSKIGPEPKPFEVLLLQT